MSINIIRLLFLIVSILAISACSAPKTYQVDLIPTPDVYAEGLVSPFPDKNPLETAPYHGILYATDRLPEEKTFLTPKSDEAIVYYKNERGALLRLGKGRIEIDRRVFTAKKDAGWKEVKKISLEKVRVATYPLQIKDIEEFGILDRTHHIFSSKADTAKKSSKPAKQYADLINKKLAISQKKDIYIYVHGYNTVFEDPLLVASELWHYMGYDGVFIAYSWPATPRGLAYLADLDTARLASRNLRIFLEYLSEETNVENIHIIGYSMGTRVTTYAIQDSGLIHKGKSHKEIQKTLHIGDVILIGSDLDRGVVAGFMMDGMLNVPKTFNIYMSDTDSALGASNWLFERARLGEAWVSKKPTELFTKFLNKNPNLRFIDVTNAKDAGSGNGHHYFTDSPWVSSDLLLTLMFGFTPEQRGLKRDGYGMWKFEKNHIQNLRRSLQKMDPKILNVNKH